MRLQATKIRVGIDSQIFELQKRGGISRYFSKILDTKVYPENQNLTIIPIFKFIRTRELPKYLSAVRISLPYSLFVKLFSKVNRNLAERIRPNILHSTYYQKDFLNLPGSYFSVVTVHDMIPEDFPNLFLENPHLEKELFCRSADLIICVSNYTKERLLHHYKNLTAEIIVIHHGVDVNYLIDENERSDQLLYVGERNGYKDFTTLLKAMEIVSQEYPKLVLRVASVKKPSKQEIDLIRSIGLSKNVIFQNVTDFELSKLYRQSLAYISTSKVEGFGLPALEAMSHRCPVILSNIEVYQELFKNGALFYDVGDHHHLSKVILEFLKDGEAREGAACNGFAIAKSMSWQNCIVETHKAYINLYKNGNLEGQG
jgi:glycosyltransferase involved in cell wall biosynthesis